MCKGLIAYHFITAHHFTSSHTFLSYFKVVLNDSSPGFLKLFQNFPLDIGLFVI